MTITRDNLFEAISNNVQYYINYHTEYDVYYNYDDIEPEHYENIESIEFNDIDLLKVIDLYTYGIENEFDIKLSDIDKFCIDLILKSNGAYKSVNYDYEITATPYGDEVWYISIAEDIFNAIIANISDLLNIEDDIKKIQYALYLDYKCFSDDTNNINSIEVKNINFEDIRVNWNYIPKEKYEYSDIHLLTREYPVWIVKATWLKYRLIDWFHRYYSIKEWKWKRKKFKYIIIK